MNWLRSIIAILMMLSLQTNVQAQTQPKIQVQDCVVLLHGLARSSGSLSSLERRLQRAGYYTVNQNYPSTEYAIETLAQDTIDQALVKCPSDSQVNFVTHSMGGILVRQYLVDHTISNMGRVVMLGPPNKGSQVVDELKNVPGFKLINGPAGMQLGTGEWSVPNRLGPANFEVGIIAGTRSINLLLSTLLPNPDDGKVSVENTKLEGMSDHIALPVTHPLMMNNRQVAEQVISFLKQGSFKREYTLDSKVLLINSQRVSCMGMVPQRCMQTRENVSDSWQYFYGEIAGFEYQEGFNYKIRVDIYPIANPPADGSSLRYVFRELLYKKAVP